MPFVIAFLQTIRTSAAPASEFDHANRSPYLKVGMLVYKMSRLSIDPRAALWIDPLLRNRPHSFLSLDTQDIERGQLECA